VPPPQAAKPGIIPLRPLGIGELLEGGLGFIRSNPRTILGLAAVIALVVALVQTLGAWAALAALGPRLDGFVPVGVPADVAAQLTDLLTLSVAQGLPGIITGLLQVVASGLFIVLVAAAALGTPLDARGTWQLLRPRLLALIGLTLLVVIGGALALAAITFVTIAVVSVLGPAVALLALLFVLMVGVGMFYVYVRLAVAAPALVLEGLGSVAALGRSWRLVQGSWWRVLGVLVLTAMITGLLTAVVSVPVGLLTTAIAGLDPSTAAVVVSSGVTSVIAGIVTWPFTAAVSGLLYIDLRMRKERLDLALVAATGRPQGDIDPLLAYRRSGGPPA
jgi:hypothetical protein